MNPFSTLRLADDATPGEVKKAYRALLRQVHPDVTGEAGHQAAVDVIAAYERALVIAQARAARTAEPVKVAGFVPARHPAHGAWILKSSGFVASTFDAVA